MLHTFDCQPDIISLRGNDGIHQHGTTRDVLALDKHTFVSIFHGDVQCTDFERGSQRK